MNIRLEQIESDDERKVGLLRGDDLLTELLRFEPAALHALYAAVGDYRRGTPPSLPLTLREASSAATKSSADASA